MTNGCRLETKRPLNASLLEDLHRAGYDTSLRRLPTGRYEVVVYQHKRKVLTIVGFTAEQAVRRAHWRFCPASLPAETVSVELRKRFPPIQRAAHEALRNLGALTDEKA